MDPGASFRPPGLKIGSLRVDPPVLLAPMAGVTDETYRELMAEHGAGLVTTEMVSAEGMKRAQPSTLRLCAQRRPLPVPLAVQLFGNDPGTVAEAAKRVEGMGAALIDINAGCPVRKVVRQGAGASLLRNPLQLAHLVEQTKAAVDIPVTVKIRLGWDQQAINVLDVARTLCAAGVDGITLHARTAVQFYSGAANWRWIGRLKEAVTVPVIGNGDITSPALAQQMFRETRCDGIMIARASLGNPWLFSKVAEALGMPPRWETAPGWLDFYETVVRHVESSILQRGKPAGHFRKLLIWYSKGCPGASRLRGELAMLEQPERMLRLFYAWIQRLMLHGVPFLPTKIPGAAA